MSTRYPGGLISRSKPVIVGPVDGEGGSAPGVWTLEQASYYTKQGTWPKPVIQGSLYSWGLNSNGQLALNDRNNRSSPVQVGGNTWAIVRGGIATVVAKKSDGTLWACGYNAYGYLGQGNTISRSSPVQVGLLTTWLNISSSNYSCIAVKNDGTLWTWGRNDFGAIGQNNTINTSSPVQVGSGGDWLKAENCGAWSSAAIKSNGTLWVWGYNNNGQLGQNNTINVSSPVQVGTDTNWASTAINFSGERCIAIKTTGSLWSWGKNNYGTLGTGNVIYRSSPVQVGALTNWLQSTTDGYTTMAIKTDGTLWEWGISLDLVNVRSSPVQIGSLNNWKSVALNGSVIATKTDGTLWAWGYNTNGQLGTGDRVDKSSPVQIGSFNTWSRVAAGQGCSYAL